MKINVLKINKVIRNLDVQSTIEGIIADRIAEMYSAKITEYGYSHLLSQYFDSIFITDLDNSFLPVISKSEPIDVKMFFVKSGFIMQTSKAYNHTIFMSMWQNIEALVNDRLDNLFSYQPKNDLQCAINDFLVDFEINSGQISNYFINLQKNYEDGVYNEEVAISVAPNLKKLKTNLSVPQLVLLFRALNEIKPPIFDVKYKKELVDFIVANFETKGTSSLKSDSIGNKFSEFDQKSRDFWLKHISTIQKYILDLEDK
jgi:hypothetical protein